MYEALLELYENIKEDPSYGLPGDGNDRQRIRRVVILSQDGDILDIEELYDNTFLEVPYAKGSTSGIYSKFLFGNIEYVFGLPHEEKLENKKDPQKYLKKVKERQENFKEKHLNFKKDIESEDYDVFCKFLNKWESKQENEHIKKWQKVKSEKGGFCIFRIAGRDEYLHENKKVKEWWKTFGEQEWNKDEKEDKSGQCSVTGKHGKLARIHEPKIKGVKNTEAGGASLTSFNQESFCSFGENQGYNAPINYKVSRNCLQTLNVLLNGPRSKEHTMVVGDTTLVFWTDASIPSTDNPLFSIIGDEAYNAQSTVNLKSLSESFKQARKGLATKGLTTKGNYYVLGLVGCGARIEVKFFYKNGCNEIYSAIEKHIKNIAMKANQDNVPSAKHIIYTLFNKKQSLARLLDTLCKSIMHKSPYPREVYIKAIRNFHNFSKTEQSVVVSFIKAFLIRNRKKDINMSLDKNSKDFSYLCGRLLAIAAKCGIDQSKPEGSFKKREFPNALNNPQGIIPKMEKRFERLVNRLEGEGKRVFYQKEFREVMDLIDPKSSPKFFSEEAKGLLIVGYYQQMKSFYTKKEESRENNDNGK